MQPGGPSQRVSRWRWWLGLTLQSGDRPCRPSLSRASAAPHVTAGDSQQAGAGLQEVRELLHPGRRAATLASGRAVGRSRAPASSGGGPGGRLGSTRPHSLERGEGPALGGRPSPWAPAACSGKRRARELRLAGPRLQGSVWRRGPVGQLGTALTLWDGVSLEVTAPGPRPCLGTRVASRWRPGLGWGLSCCPAPRRAQQAFRPVSAPH